MDRRLSGHAALMEPDVRTPMAWQHRDQLYGYQHSAIGEQLYTTRAPRGSSSSRPGRTASPMDTSNTSSLSSESHVRSGSQIMHSSLLNGLPPHVGASSASVAAATAASLTPWDGDPYAVPVQLHLQHLQHLPLAVPVSLPPHQHMLPPNMPPQMMLPPPAILLPPMLRPRPLVFPAVPSSPTPPEPLPVREPKTAMLSLPPKELVSPRRKMRCCRGGCIVLWIILGIIFVGVMLATALRFVVP